MFATSPGQLINLDWIIIIIFKEYKIMKLQITKLLKPPFYVETFSSTPRFETQCMCAFYGRCCSWPGAILVPVSVATSLAECYSC
jgi:hypothetical protein